MLRRVALVLGAPAPASAAAPRPGCGPPARGRRAARTAWRGQARPRWPARTPIRAQREPGVGRVPHVPVLPSAVTTWWTGLDLDLVLEEPAERRDGPGPEPGAGHDQRDPRDHRPLPPAGPQHAAVPADPDGPRRPHRRGEAISTSDVGSREVQVARRASAARTLITPSKATQARGHAVEDGRGLPPAEERAAGHAASSPPGRSRVSPARRQYRRISAPSGHAPSGHAPSWGTPHPGTPHPGPPAAPRAPAPPRPAPPRLRAPRLRVGFPS